jgi:hypothetical protein
LEATRLKDLTLNDDTQVEVLRHLATTERLLTRVASKLSGGKRIAEICGMPDLGFPSNVRRAHGGFYTGAFYAWETDTPFIPVDSTVNCCGVSLWRLSSDLGVEIDFLKTVLAARQATEDTDYLWNYESGNHFITYGTITGSDSVPDGYYLVIHSSAAEYKKQVYGLYPEPGNWYSNEVLIESDPDSGRYLRYILGTTAERFAAQAKELEKFNQHRHCWLAEKLACGIGIAEEILNVQHYGMPDQNSVAIGCQWEAVPYLLLTGPRLPLYLVNPAKGGKNCFGEFLLTPHGLGMRATESPVIHYRGDGLEINREVYRFNEAMKGAFGMELRMFDYPLDNSIPTIVREVLMRCPGEIIATLQPEFSYPKR